MRRSCIVCALFCFLCWGCGNSVSGVPPLQTPVPTVATHAAGNAPLATPRPTATVTSPAVTTATATRAPAVASTATTITFALPHIGDAISTWDRAYGTHMDVSSTQLKMHQYTDDTGSAPFTVIASYDPMQNNRVFTITVRSDSQMWSPDNIQQHNYPLLFLPTDSNLSLHAVLTTGVEDQYYSALLGTAFPASYFIDNAGKRVRPGSVNVFYRDADSSNAIMHATISLGTVYGL